MSLPREFKLLAAATKFPQVLIFKVIFKRVIFKKITLTIVVLFSVINCFSGTRQF